MDGWIRYYYQVVNQLVGNLSFLKQDSFGNMQHLYNCFIFLNYCRLKDKISTPNTVLELFIGNRK